MISTEGFRRFFEPSIARYIGVRLLLIGFIISLLLVAISVAMSVSEQQAQVRASVAELVQKSLPSISTSVYTIDAEQLGIQLDSLLFNPYIEFAQVTEIRGSRKIYTNRGTVPEAYDFILEMPLRYRGVSGERDDYGQLSVIATFKATYDDILRAALRLFISNMLLLLLAVITASWLVRAKLLRHINQLATMHEDLCADNLAQRFEFDRPSHGFQRPDELDRLLISANICRRQFSHQQLLREDNAPEPFDASSHKIWDKESLSELLDGAVARYDVMRDPFTLMLFEIKNTFDKRSDHLQSQLLLVVAKRTIAQVLQSRAIATAEEEGVRIAQCGPNKFALLINRVGNPTHCISIAERLLSLFQQEVIIGARTLQPVINFGVCICPLDGRTRQSLLASAEYALRLAAAESPASGFKLHEKT